MIFVAVFALMYVVMVFVLVGMKYGFMVSSLNVLGSLTLAFYVATSRNAPFENIHFLLAFGLMFIPITVLWFEALAQLITQPKKVAK